MTIVHVSCPYRHCEGRVELEHDDGGWVIGSCDECLCDSWHPTDEAAMLADAEGTLADYAYEYAMAKWNDGPFGGDGRDD